RKAALLDVVTASIADLRARFDVVVCEGAGSPAEINLRANDIANMGLAQAADLPVVVVGDIDRGGVLAHLFGTVAVLDPADQRRSAVFVVNKFRGDPTLLRPGAAAREPVAAGGRRAVAPDLERHRRRGAGLRARRRRALRDRALPPGRRRPRGPPRHARDGGR